MPLRPVIAVFLTLLLNAATVAQTQPAIARPVRHWAPAKPFEFDRMTLRLDLPDLTRQEASCSVDLTVRAVATSVRDLVLTARNQTLKVSRVRVDGQVASFVHDGDELTVQLPVETRRGDKRAVRVDYVLKGTLPEGVRANLHAGGGRVLGSCLYPGADGLLELLVPLQG